MEINETDKMKPFWLCPEIGIPNDSLEIGKNTNLENDKYNFKTAKRGNWLPQQAEKREYSYRKDKRNK